LVVVQVMVEQAPVYLLLEEYPLWFLLVQTPEPEHLPQQS